MNVRNDRCRVAVAADSLSASAIQKARDFVRVIFCAPRCSSLLSLCSLSLSLAQSAYAMKLWHMITRELFEYESPVILRVRDRRLAVPYRIIQACIIVWILVRSHHDDTQTH